MLQISTREENTITSTHRHQSNIYIPGESVDSDVVLKDNKSCWRYS